MVSRFFGLPGCGKTTTLAALAYSGLKSGKYRNVYGNVHMTIPGYTYIPFDVLGKYQLEDCLVLIDEAMVECGDRDYKGFGKEKLELFVMHRHYNMDIILFSQEADGVDKKVRSVSANMFYVKKGFWTGRWISNIYRIPYGIVWPSERDNGENLGKIVMGYIKPSLLSRLFARRLWRPKYYQYFDSWEAKELPPLPSRVNIGNAKEKILVDIIKNPGSIPPRFWLLRHLYKTRILLRSHKRLKRRLRKLRRADRRAASRQRDQATLDRLNAPGVYDLKKELIHHA